MYLTFPSKDPVARLLNAQYIMSKRTGSRNHWVYVKPRPETGYIAFVFICIFSQARRNAQRLSAEARVERLHLLNSPGRAANSTAPQEPRRRSDRIAKALHNFVFVHVLSPQPELVPGHRYRHRKSPKKKYRTYSVPAKHRWLV